MAFDPFMVNIGLWFLPPSCWHTLLLMTLSSVAMAKSGLLVILQYSSIRVDSPVYLK